MNQRPDAGHNQGHQHREGINEQAKIHLKVAYGRPIPQPDRLGMLRQAGDLHKDQHPDDKGQDNCPNANHAVESTA